MHATPMVILSGTLGYIVSPKLAYVGFSFALLFFCRENIAAVSLSLKFIMMDFFILSFIDTYFVMPISWRLSCKLSMRSGVCFVSCAGKDACIEVATLCRDLCFPVEIAGHSVMFVDRKITTTTNLDGMKWILIQKQRLFPGFEPMTSKSQDSNLTVTPRLTLRLVLLDMQELRLFQDSVRNIRIEGFGPAVKFVSSGRLSVTIAIVTFLYEGSICSKIWHFGDFFGDGLVAYLFTSHSLEPDLFTYHIVITLFCFDTAIPMKSRILLGTEE
ncbi:hypothetical protein VNO77_29216 [Canavalia gladiata]|uniref:Uncharacterized protein n=1 Tax=Canavalia gladiata TaxID=3824 RepID=A0AAN9KZL8_CANGL